MQLIYTLIPIVISCAAFAFSVFTWRERKAKDQRDLFLRIHERLIDVDLQRGRGILFQGGEVKSTEDAQKLFKDRRKDYEVVNRTLAMPDIAALYVERGYIDSELFFQEWGFTYASILEHAEYFIDERASRIVRSAGRSWQHFRFLAGQAAKGPWSNENASTQLAEHSDP
jgi:hypothetical protein